jgi:hypothetical protein
MVSFRFMQDEGMRSVECVRPSLADPAGGDNDAGVQRREFMPWGSYFIAQYQDFLSEMPLEHSQGPSVA